MKVLKQANIYEGLVLQLIKSKKNYKFFLLKFLWVTSGLSKPISFVLKALPCAHSLTNYFKLLNLSNYGLNYIFVLRYLYCFGAYCSKNLKI